jgi:hypothetical protein
MRDHGAQQSDRAHDGHLLLASDRSQMGIARQQGAGFLLGERECQIVVVTRFRAVFCLQQVIVLER